MSNAERFFETVKAKHKNKYDYSLAKYVNSKTKIKIICTTHGEFNQLPTAHSRGAGCKKCANEKMRKERSMSVEEFIRRAVKTHGDKYDYSETKGIDEKKKVKIKCNLHGYFYQNMTEHISGKGCKECGVERSANSKLKSTKQIISEFKEAHKNRYDYSKVEYMGCYNKVEIICKKHGAFFQTPTDHKSGQNCPKCANMSRGGKRRKTLDEFIMQSISTHGELYDYSKVAYKNSGTKVEIICNAHGSFFQNPTSHIKGYGCPECARLKMFGKGNNFYKNGEYINKRSTRKDNKYYRWAYAIKKNKEFCECCGEKFKKGNPAHAHHLDCYINFKEKRYDLNNGVAICGNCHFGFHNEYGRKMTTKEQYYEYKHKKKTCT